MSAVRRPGPAKIAAGALARYPDRLDVRSPSEFALDHLPGAVNLPVLNDSERALVGTIYARESAFAAKKRGAALVARNIAHIVDVHCRDQPREWSPVVYCWRGGQRSAALAHVLHEIGFQVAQLDGGYQAYRRHVVAVLAPLPARFTFVVVCGLTGAGKSRLLSALAGIGTQVLDLEALAKHRGSLLGDLPDEPQPSQKAFESQLLAALERFDSEVPVYVESESRRIGSVQMPEALLQAMRASSCVRIDTPHPLRVALLKEEYQHFLGDPASLAAKLARLEPLFGPAVVADWANAAATGGFDSLVAELLRKHYDPTYSRSMEKNFPRSASAHRVVPKAIDGESFRALAREIDAHFGASIVVPA
ncbi:MAG: tRNA 2-selenouridine(34) synthase MnmH [Betaproteobacteria bacterium]|nr:tRNA 2-selenouridine(34) synthase MnmH [Betaproteobacteria bacterium]